MKYVNTRDFGEIANGLSKYFVYGKYELLYAAKYDNIIKSITSYNRIYIDKRLRLNVHIDPMKDYIENGKLVVVDVLNQSESLEKNCLLLIPLFDESIIEQIGLSKYISIEKYRNYVSDSRIMNMERLISYTRRTPFFILRKSYYPIHLYEDWNSSVLKLENNDNNKAVIPISLFYIEEGKFIQEWESNISNVDFDEKREFVMYKDIIFDKGEYLLSIDMKSNYRDPKSHLRIYVNDSLVNRIYLDTTKEMMQSNRAHHLLSKLPGFRKWRNNFFEIDNSSKIKINRKGKKRVKIEIISGSNRGHVRLKDLAIYDRGINQAAYDKTFS